ncbi:hypothetical protein MKW98_028334 [Papaver atlanticum]|uniref:AAA+ ATPase domain-containing protein n=1 Tax=Papaver atlanticum TaxID=357466 RepID=A0AAD4XLX9_9MAGN|nr:hypothetical protein MKW98_028334 [Papaver atlanticum]
MGCSVDEVLILLYCDFSWFWLQLLKEPGSYVGEVVKVMGKSEVLVKVHLEGKYVVDIDRSIDIAKFTPTTRVALRNDNYALHLILPSKVDPLVNLMKVGKSVIELPIKHPELFESIGIYSSTKVLLYAPSATGKTLLARAVAHHTDCTFVRVSGFELVQKYIREGSGIVRELFVMAREHAPSIIFMDKIDSIDSTRMESGSGNGDSEVQRTMPELFKQLDGFEASKKRLKRLTYSSPQVLMATNRNNILDPTLLRPGRIDRKIEFPNPNEDVRVSVCLSRASILRTHSRSICLIWFIFCFFPVHTVDGELFVACNESLNHPFLFLLDLMVTRMQGKLMASKMSLISWAGIVKICIGISL